jgi:hypothetical protein
LANSPSGPFGVSLTLFGATKSIYELSVEVTTGYHGAGTYAISQSQYQAASQPAGTAAITVADSFTHQFWKATYGRVTITGSGNSGIVSADLRPTSGSAATKSPSAAKLSGPWACD